MKTSCLSFGFMGLFQAWLWLGVQSQAARSAGCRCPLEVFDTTAEEGEIGASLGDTQCCTALLVKQLPSWLSD